MTTPTTIFVTKGFRTVECCKVLEQLDSNGNTVYMAVNKVDNETNRFWSFGGAELHLKLSGLLRG